MNIEEAGEEYLLGPYRDCSYCKGEGINKLDSACSNCKGSGKEVRNKYIEACEVLGCSDEALAALANLTKLVNATRKRVNEFKFMQTIEAVQKETRRKQEATLTKMNEQITRILREQR